MLALCVSGVAGHAQSGPLKASTGTPDARAEYERALSARKASQSAQALDGFRRAIERDPTFVEAHEGFIRESRRWSSTTKEMTAASLTTVYLDWTKQAPENPVYHWGLGRTLDDLNEAAEAYRRAVTLDPGFARAWFDRGTNAELRGDRRLYVECVRRASEAAPDDTAYRSLYAWAVRADDPALADRALDDVAARHPVTEDVGKALYWRAYFATTPDERAAKFTHAIERLSGTGNRWFESAARELVLLRLTDDPFAAQTVLRSALREKPADQWLVSLVPTVDAMAKARTSIDRGRFTEAKAALDAVGSPVGMAATAFSLMRVQVENGLGEVRSGYDRLIAMMASEPDDGVRSKLSRQAARLGRSADRVARDIREARVRRSHVVPDFQFPDVRTGAPVRLSDLRGKVVLLSFWFPT
jgi:tetratricopeptide (TPR) repeat protein/plasmid stability protein